MKHLSVYASSRKLTDDQVRSLRAQRGSGEKIAVLAATFGVSESAVSRICAGLTYGWIVEDQSYGWIGQEVTDGVS